jgi:hypothetical protein
MGPSRVSSHDSVFSKELATLALRRVPAPLPKGSLKFGVFAKSVTAI